MKDNEPESPMRIYTKSVEYNSSESLATDDPSLATNFRGSKIQTRLQLCPRLKFLLRIRNAQYFEDFELFITERKKSIFLARSNVVPRALVRHTLMNTLVLFVQICQTSCQHYRFYSWLGDFGYVTLVQNNTG